MDVYSLTDKAIMREIGQRIRQYRLDCDKSQKALAQEAGLSLSTVAKLEKGGSVAYTSLIAALRAVSRLDLIEPLMKEPEVSPIAYARLLEGTKIKKRASASRNIQKEGSEEW